MILHDKNSFYEGCKNSLEEIRLMLDSLPEADLKDFPSKRTALVFIDLINGFIKSGALSDRRYESLLPEAAKLLKASNQAGIPVIAFADCHNAKSPEFSHFPPHCLKGSDESKIADELALAGEYILIPKNSRNGCMTKKFQEFKIHHPEINHYIIAGVCTDICVLQFALTLLSHFHEENKECKITVPLNLVDTYDKGSHSEALMNAAALKIIADSGVTLIKKIQAEAGEAL